MSHIDSPDVIYFNNCRGRDHAAIFGSGAFFDLGREGPQHKQATDLPIGQECCVASYAPDGSVVFDWYSLTGESLMTDNDDISCRVFFGDLLSTETMVKAAAAKSTSYSPFFNRNGHFKRPSVVVASVAATSRPRNRRIQNTYCPEEVDLSAGPYIEGTTRRVVVNAYERNAKARSACLKALGTACCICGFEFRSIYGDAAAGYIHVHHKLPLAQLQREYEIDPVADLCPVCPNCHAVIHLGGAVRTVEEVKAMIANRPK
jgi:predicted HNH restriction endonuclease